MLQRTITAAVGIALLVVACIFSDTIAFPILICLIAIIGVNEMLGCIGLRKSFISSFCLYFMTAVIMTLTQTIESHSLFVAAFASVLFCTLFIMLTASVFSEGKIPVDKACIGFTTCAYVITGFVSIIQLRDMKFGEITYLLVFIAPWVSDTFAYFCGRLFGRHKLIPSVSPKKTVEGAIGGVVFCIIGCVVYRLILGNFYESLPPYWVFAILGLVVAVVSQIGDLIFSLIKRRYDLKDYGKLFPGHGGVLDRFDSVIASAPLILIVCETLVLFKVM